MDRDENLNRAVERTEPWDIVVIGGGATGAGCALDAAARGLSVLLLEQHDFGKGTSSRSTKLIHGGVRYLRQGNISLVRESLRERGLLLQNAPHVVHEQEFVIPCYSHWDKIFYGFGMKVYDALAGKYSIGRSRMLSRSEVIERLPNIETAGLKGGVLYCDGQFDDTRLLIDILRTAGSHGAVVLNYARVTSILKVDDGRINGVEFENVETGEFHTVGTKAVINATGAFCSVIQEMGDENSKPVITYSQGVHLVFDHKFLPRSSALMIPKTSDGRVLFCIPWHDHLLAGTTDTPVDRPVLEPEALESEIEFILDTAGEYLAKQPTRSDVLSVFAGIRPLIKKGSSNNTSTLSRSHDLFVDASGLVTITGGKWTTCRQMAEDAVNKAAEIAGSEPRECITQNISILSPEPSVETAKLHPDLNITRGNVIRAVRDEMARSIEDVLARRTRALFLNAKAATEMSPAVAEIIAKELLQDRKWIDAQVVAFRTIAESYAHH